MEPSMQPSSLSDYLARLDTVPWFSTIGTPIPESPGVPRISGWDEWPGPEDDNVSALALRQQAPLRRDHGRWLPNHLLKRTWDQIHEAVFRRVLLAVPYDPAQDAWHAPSSAVWQAAWTAGLVGLCLAAGRSIPEDLQTQWQWFLRGHWPCGYKSVGDDGQPGPLVVL